MPKIMLVEDDNNLREIYGARLQAEGHTIVSAKDGEEALALAVKEKPDLIISDVMMPKISGFDMLDILRNAPETKNTKVIMMTALSQAEDKARADKLGADMYLVKSQVTLEDVAKAVDKVLTGESQATEQPPAEPTEPISQPAPEVTPPPPVEAPQAAAAVPQAQAAEPQTNAAAPTPSDQSVSPPVAQQDTSANIPPPAAPADTSPPTKIEVTEHTEPEPVVEPPKPTESPESTASNPQPAPLEVVLPSSPDEAGGNKPAESNYTVQVPEKASEEPAAPAPDIGPNLDQVLSEEGQSEDGSSQPETGVPAPTPETEKPDEIASTESNEPKPLDEKPQKKVIQPINDPTAKPDINELLAKEEAKEAAQNPQSAQPQPAQPAPQDNTSDNNQAQNTAGNNPPKQQPPDDFSKIAL